MRVRYSFSAKLTQKTRKPVYTNQHKVSFSKQAQEVIEKSDIILEILDARFIDKTRNLELEKVAKQKGKKIVFVLNKSDLIDINELKSNYNLSSMQPYVLFSIKNKVGRARLKKILNIEASKTKFKKARIGVVGYPNTGKSSIINVLAARKKAQTSPQAGSTKNIQEIRFSKDILILDSPGVLLEGEETSRDTNVIKNQTEIGAKDYHRVRYPDLIVNEIIMQNPHLLDEFYKIDSGDDCEALLEKLGRRLNFLKKGGEVDTDRTARKILKDWQEGKIQKKIDIKG